jgi:catechol 2,3-dioxygenase
MSTTQSHGTQGSIVPAEASPSPIDPNLTIGHVHLRTADIDRVREFYVGVLGFDVVIEARDVPGWGTTGDVLFVSAGGYHHHLAFNIWRGAGVPPVPEDVVGLRRWTVELGDTEALAAIRDRLSAAGVDYEDRDGGLLVRDPWDIAVLITGAPA